MKRFSFIVYFISLFVNGQDSAVLKIPRPELHGYLKYMEQFAFIDDPAYNTSTSLLHNRLNFKWAPQYFMLRVEARNRIIYGEQLKLDPSYMKSVAGDQGLVKLSKLWLDGFGLGIVSHIDRALLNFNNGAWDITVGRQRINWGVNMVWNPNDVFNTYNFFDFDYEERPGSDAVRVQYMWKGFSAIEVAAKKGNKADDQTVALMYRSNIKGYDHQVLTGITGKDLFAGIGWAGNIYKSGFKGELTYFHSYEYLTDTTGALSSCISMDYSFNDGWYVNLSGYYNSNGRDKLSYLSTQQFFNINAKQLLPFKYTGFVQVSKQINPLLSVGVSNIYSLSNNTWILVPNIQYSIASNWELSLIGQSFFADVNNVYRSLGNNVFMRLKWSF